MAIVITGDLDWTGDLLLFLTALDGGPAADGDGYAFTAAGDLEYSCEVPEPVSPGDRLLGTYRCVAKVSDAEDAIIAGAGYVTISAATAAVRIQSTPPAVLDPAYDAAKTAASQASVNAAMATLNVQSEAY